MPIRTAMIMFCLFCCALVSSNSIIYAQKKELEKEIWSGKSANIRLRWTSNELYAETSSGNISCFKPLVDRGFKDFIAINTEPGEPAPKCDYERTFKILSVVGSLISFEDQYYDDCGGAHPSGDTRFTTIDLAKSGDLFYARGIETPMMDIDLANPGRVVKLTDYFAEQDILKALLADEIIKEALVNRKTPKTLTALPEIFAEDSYGLRDSGYELRPDFLTRFTFHHLEGNKVAVRIGLPPHFGANRNTHSQLGILLPMPSSLKDLLARADLQQEGFLAKDAARIAHNLATNIKLKTNKTVLQRIKMIQEKV